MSQIVGVCLSSKLSFFLNTPTFSIIKFLAYVYQTKDIWETVHLVKEVL